MNRSVLETGNTLPRYKTKYIESSRRDVKEKEKNSKAKQDLISNPEGIKFHDLRTMS